MICEYFECVDSTMSVAERYVTEKKYDDEFALIARTQSKGRGRKNNDWLSPEGGLWFSYVMNHLTVQKGFTLYVGCCVVRSLELGAGSWEQGRALQLRDGDWRFMIKWPNDVYLVTERDGGKKVCGLICSQYSQHNKTIIGVGINTNISTMPDDAPVHSGSILEILGVTIDNEACFNYIIDNIKGGLSEFERKGLAVINDFYKEHDYLFGKRIKVVSGDEEYNGMYAGIDEDGGLMMEMERGGVKRVYSGSVVEV
jgi:BirA family biotin operon repressor/biotin-[acetyl-CoA-carboxylase] ligase